MKSYIRQVLITMLITILFMFFLDMVTILNTPMYRSPKIHWEINLMIGGVSGFIGATLMASPSAWAWIGKKIGAV